MASCGCMDTFSCSGAYMSTLSTSSWSQQLWQDEYCSVLFYNNGKNYCTYQTHRTRRQGEVQEQFNKYQTSGDW